MHDKQIQWEVVYCDINKVVIWSGSGMYNPMETIKTHGHNLGEGLLPTWIIERCNWEQINGESQVVTAIQISYVHKSWVTKEAWNYIQ